MSVVSFLEWLAATPASVALHESRYLYLIVLATHVLTLCVFLGTAMIVDLRLLGISMPRIPVSEVLARLLPWTVGGFVVMLVTGSLMFYAAPVEKYGNLFFRAKMIMLLLAGVMVWLFFQTVHRRIEEWDRDSKPPPLARVTGGVTLLLWFAILTAGRMIPYQQYWFD